MTNLGRRRFLGGFAGAVCTAWSPGVRADEPAEELLSRIAKARDPVRTLRGAFTQTRTIGLLATDVVSRGTMTIVRPDRLRWELDPPDAITFWLGPDGAAYRDEHGEGRLPATSARIVTALGDLKTLLCGDLRDLNDHWSLRVLRDDAQGCELEAEARATSPASARRIRMALAADLVRPASVRIDDGPRDATTIAFALSDMQINAPVDSRSMQP